MEEKDIDLYEVVEEEDSNNVLDEEGDEGVGDDWNWEDEEEEELEEVEDKMEEVEGDPEPEPLNGEVLEESYNSYTKAYTNITELLSSIIESGEYTEEHRKQVNQATNNYDKAHYDLRTQIQISDDFVLENKLNEVLGMGVANTQEAVFQALTDGKVQGLFKDEEGHIYLNAQFLQARGMQIVDDNDNVVLAIDYEGNLTTQGDIVGSTMYSGTILTEAVNIMGTDGLLKLSNNKISVVDKSEVERVGLGDLNQDQTNFGFVLRDKAGKVVFKVDNTGATFTGTVNMIGGAVPDTALSSNIQEGLLAGATAFNRVEGWTTKGTTTIDGGKITTDSVTSKQIKAGSITADHLKVGALDGKTITGATLKGGTFFTAPDPSETEGHAFRIYADGRVYSKNTIQVYGTAGNGSYSQLRDGTITATNYIQCSGYKTENATMYFGIDGASVDSPTGDNTRRIKFTRQGSNSYLMPDFPSSSSTNGVRLGGQTYMWNIVYAKNGVSSSSDRFLKENIRYIEKELPNQNAVTCGAGSEDITGQDLYNFVKDDLFLAQYNFIDDTEDKIGFIAQDLLYNTDGSDNKVGQLIIDDYRESDGDPDNPPPLCYNETVYTNVLAGALKEAIKEIEILKKEVKELKGLISA